MPLICRMSCRIRSATLAVALGIFALIAHGGARAAEEPSGVAELSPRAMLAIATHDADAFLRAWTAQRDRALAALGDPAQASAREAVLHRWSAGLIDYPYFHWRETGRSIPVDWAPYREAIARLHAEGAADALKADAPHVGSWLHDVAWRATRSDPRYATGDNRSLRARVDAITTSGFTQAVQRELVANALVVHVDENGARGIEPLADTLAALGGDAAQVEALRAQARAEDAIDPLRPAHTYQTVDGVDLRLHASRPRGEAPAPAMLWFHGGSGDTGHWSHCPVFCRTADALGVLVIQVEYRTAQRFNTLPSDAARDAEAALAWVRANAERLGVDVSRIVVAGFSTGGSMASQLALSHPRDVRAAAVMSACVRPEADAWFRRALEDAGQPVPPAQVQQLGPSSASMLLLHARDDKVCPYAHAIEFHARAVALDLPVDLDTVDGGHFFAFASPPARDQAREAFRRFLITRGLAAADGAPASPRP